MDLRITNGLLRGICNDAGVAQWSLETDTKGLLQGKWTHVALVQDGTEPILYVNGVKPAQAFSVSTDKTKWFADLTGLDNGRIGSLNFNSGGESGEFDGQMSDVKLFDEAKTAGYIKNEYERTRRFY